MSGAGFSFAMLASFKSNRDAIKNKNRFHKRAKGLKTHHIDTHDSKHFTKAQFITFRKELLREKAKERKSLIVTFAVIVFLLVVSIVLVSTPINVDLFQK